MKKKIAFYISANGRASANRCSVIIETILRMEEETEIFILSAEWVLNLLKVYLNGEERVHYYIEETDADICYLEGCGCVDWDATAQQEEAFVEKWDDLIGKAEVFLAEQGIGLVVSDLCPWILEAADHLRIRSILISDYTWDQMYEGILEEDICDAYRECYEMASKVIAYDVHQPEMEHMVDDYELVSLMARPYNMELIEKIQREAEKPLVYLQIDAGGSDSIDGLPYIFINGSNETLEGDNVLVLERFAENAHNYIAASDYVIAYPEWDVAASALLSNRKAAYLSREHMISEEKRVALLKERSQCVEISKEDLNDIGGILKRLDELEYSYDIGYHNDDYDVAKIILNYYPRKKRRRKDEK